MTAYAHIQVHKWHATRVEVREQFADIDSFLALCESRGMNPVHQTWPPVLLPTELSFCPLTTALNKLPLLLLQPYVSDRLYVKGHKKRRYLRDALHI